MLAGKRRAELLEIVRSNSSAQTKTLAERFGVSSQTIRRDLRLLEAEGLLHKVYGGGMSVNYDGSSYQERELDRTEDKSSIAKQALQFVEPGMRVAITQGTTTRLIAVELEGWEVDIITNSIAVAEAASGPRTTVSLTGGRYLAHSKVLVGPEAEASLRTTFVDVGFIGVSGISEDRGYTMAGREEADIVRQFFRIAKTVVVVADSSKFNKLASFEIAPLQAAHTVVTDAGISSAQHERLKRAGVGVIVCEPRGG